MSRVAIASSTQLAADGGAFVAERGGNAVDTAIAAVLVSVVTEPGICSLGSGGFLTISAPGEDPVTIDGYVTMPGLGQPPERFGQGGIDVHLEYGGGVDMTVGHGSVATPGALAALETASRRFGCLPWADLLEPAYRHARDGYPLPQVSYDYLKFSHSAVYGWNPTSFAAVHDDAGEVLRPGSRVHIKDLAESLRLIAAEGTDAFYRGEIADLIEADSLAGGGLLTRADLEAFESIVRSPIEVRQAEWTIWTNPAPAIGGATLAAMLLLMRGRPAGRWSAAELAHWIRVQEAVFRYRLERLDLAEDTQGEVSRLLDLAGKGDVDRFLTSPSTVHTSAVDSGGLACAVTVSAGYGAGVMPPGTGIWMNNCLGELELNRRGLHGWPVGRRLASNMAPTIGRSSDGSVFAIGSAGASRITTAILQTLVNFISLGISLEDAVSHPRVHVEQVRGETEATEDGSAWRVAYEPGMPVDELRLASRAFDAPDMFFGGVGAVLWSPHHGFELAADQRRGGGTAIAGS